MTNFILNCEHLEVFQFFHIYDYYLTVVNETKQKTKFEQFVILLKYLLLICYINDLISNNRYLNLLLY